ncbi:hypothetical protein T265_05153 [Opisthorchis viverrini]|uniref:Uncharacterized protein n=1 Tax=Opisthorchis viverrini TaxID=6198 RepID=A0A075AFK8_OPIVI|nr:hypothetical protein T265_05153 [Opisthorchis viverrini]KER27864.1 hypothetical protein T265_05153 [Opisthorchis viverrini]
MTAETSRRRTWAFSAYAHRAEAQTEKLTFPEAALITWFALASDIVSDVAYGTIFDTALIEDSVTVPIGNPIIFCRFS